jgi:hypothetical protein
MCISSLTVSTIEEKLEQTTHKWQDRDVHHSNVIRAVDFQRGVNHTAVGLGQHGIRTWKTGDYEIGWKGLERSAYQWGGRAG